MQVTTISIQRNVEVFLYINNLTFHFLEQLWLISFKLQSYSSRIYSILFWLVKMCVHISLFIYVLQPSVSHCISKTLFRLYIISVWRSLKRWKTVYVLYYMSLKNNHQRLQARESKDLPINIQMVGFHIWPEIVSGLIQICLR